MYAKILVATDGSPTAQRAVERGLDVAASLGSSTTILTVAPPKKGAAVIEATLAEHTARTQPMQTLIQDGDPASVILDVAEEIGADLIVVGNKGMQGARRFFLSSIPNKVAHHATSAVLIVKTT